MNSTSTKSDPAAARQRRRRKKLLAALMLIVCMGAAVFLGVLGLNELLERGEGDGYYDSLANLRATEEPVFLPGTAPTAYLRPFVTSPPTRKPAPGATAEPEASELPGDAAAEASATPGSAIDFDTLLLTCPDAVGWLRLEDSPIDYPIVQGSDNSFYLTHLPDRRENINGSIMMDVDNDPLFQDDVTILHGHNMRSGAMFGLLDQYYHEEYYKGHETMTLYTPGGDYTVEVVAAWMVDGETFGYPTFFESSELFDRFIQRAKSQSKFESGVEVQYGDKLLLMSTCAYVFESARYIVLGVLRPIA